jgi:predicted P-loop ATPase
MIELNVVSSFAGDGASKMEQKADPYDGLRQEQMIYREGKVQQTPESFRRALRNMGVKLRYDAFAFEEVVVWPATIQGHGPIVDDAVMEYFYLQIWEYQRLKIGMEDFKRIVRNYARQDTFHPVRDYFDRLQWDGKPRLDTWLQVYGNAPDTPFIRRVGALTLLAAVKRIYEPGCKFDEMLVLENPKQGTFKSSAWATLCPDRRWFLDDLPLTSYTREVLEKTRWKLIIEGGELVGMGMTTAKINKVKNFMSSQTDEARWVYKDKVLHKPREFVLVGSTNERQWMNDQTGNRRFWPAPAGPFDIDKLEQDRDQLWAEAAHRIKIKKESIRLEEALWSVAEDEQKKRLQFGPVLDKLENLLADVERGKITSATLMDFLYPNGVQSSKRASRN